MKEYCTLSLQIGAILLASSAQIIGAFLQEDYVLESDNLPEDRFRPPIGNGHVATNVLSDTVYMNGLYNGREDKSSRARIPAYVAVDVNVTHDSDISRKFSLDMYHGIFQQEIKTKQFRSNITYFAHRKSTRLLVTRLDITRRAHAQGDVNISINSNTGEESTDFNWNHQADDNSRGDVLYRAGTIREPELPGLPRPTLHVYHTPVPHVLTLLANQSHMSVTIIASHSLNRADALAQYQMGMGTYEELLASHKDAWKALWDDGRIDVNGNKTLSQSLAAATYNILCSLPAEDDPVLPFFGLSPGGLSRGGLLTPNHPGGGENDYAGHVFWDMDTWMMPPIMLLHPDMARRMLSSRTRALDQVKKNAKNAGYRGVKFPWEQGATGIEVTPKWAGNTSFYQIHITADVSYALRQYLYANDDVSLVTSGRGLELALEIARFWKSRVNETGHNTAEILGVMGPDEYHFNVDNSVYTNYNAKLSLTLPQYILDNFKLSPNATLRTEVEAFNRTASKILILFDQERQFHPQYQGFNLSARIKQSDVVLLGYPLMMPMTKTVRRNDLEEYEKITDPQGPDTGTWSMHTVGWLELGDKVRAQKSFKMMFRNINEPFKVFSEKPVTTTSNGGCVNFITAAGGLLQAVVFGYGGLRLRENQIDINPTSLPETRSWGIVGVHYKGVVFDIHVENVNITVKLSYKPENTMVSIQINDAVPKTLDLNRPFIYRVQLASISVHKSGANNSNTGLNQVSTPSPNGGTNDASFPSNHRVVLLLLVISLCVLFH